MAKVEANISMSLDGFVTGPNLNRYPGLGQGGEILHAWTDESRSMDFATNYQRRTGREPSYPAAQAAAAGYLAHAAHRLDLGVSDLPQWTTSTFFGDFTLDPAWRQVGHHVTTVRWQRGRMVPIAAEDGGRSPHL